MAATNMVNKKTFGNDKTILLLSGFRALPVVVDDTGVTAVNGEKIIKAGTIVGGVNGTNLANPTEMVKEQNSATDGAKAEGVLLHDVDVTNGPGKGSMVIEGYIDLDKIPKAPDTTVDLPKVTFGRKH